MIKVKLSKFFRKSTELPYFLLHAPYLISRLTMCSPQLIEVESHESNYTAPGLSCSANYQVSSSRVMKLYGYEELMTFSRIQRVLHTYIYTVYYQDNSLSRSPQKSTDIYKYVYGNTTHIDKPVIDKSHLIYLLLP